MADAVGSIVTAVIELRQYTLHPGTRETLIELFEREFVESQEECGMSVIGQFRDLDRPDRFVWMRGFDDMSGRAAALRAFYEGEAWKAHRDAANATMVDFDDVLLLKPSQMGSGFRLDIGDRPAPGAAGTTAGMLAVTIVPLADGADEEFAALFETSLRPALEIAGATVIASLVSEKSPNNFPRLPVRENASVLVWIAGFADETAHREHLRVLARRDAWRTGGTAAARLSAGDWQTLRLQPTTRSLLRHPGSTMRR